MRFRGKIAAGAIVLSGFIISSSFNWPYPQQHAVDTVDPPFLGEGQEWVDSVYESLSRDERIAQLIMIRAYSNKGPEHRENILRLVDKYNVGGLCFFQGGPVRQARLTNLYQAEAKTPLLVSMDAEWGLAFRLDSSMAYPRAMTLGAIQGDELIYNMGRDIATQRKEIGTHMNLAPVIDVNNNPRNPVINSRSFGEDPMNVSDKGIAYMKGMQEAGVLCVAKHFPGHGDTDSDSHHTLPVIRHDEERLWELEMFPFREAIQQGITGVQVAHLHLPALDSTKNIAASLSNKIITGILKERLSFKGLVMSDALEMKGVKDYHRAGELEALALMAGNDILLLPNDISKVIPAIKREIRRGGLSWERIEESCKKILAAKYWAGLNKYEPVEIEGLYGRINKDEYEATRSQLVQASLTLLENKSDIIPLQRLDTLRIATVAVGSEGKNEFQKYLELYLHADHYNISREAPAAGFLALLDSLQDYNLIIAGLHNTDMRLSKNYGITENSLLFLNELTGTIPTIACIFANPYSLSKFRFGDQIMGLLMCYEDKPVSQSFAAQVIFGGIPALGHLPVSSGEQYRAGDGISSEGFLRLRYGMPEEEGINSDLLYRVDSIAQDAIAKKATPGCQVLAARNGLVFYHKAFGHHTYSRKDTVKLSDLYDLASITKITATLPVLMKLTEQGLFDVNARLSDYITSLDTSDKGKLFIRDILTHQARLTPWIPFYYRTLEPMDQDESLLSNKLSSKYPFRLAGHIFLNKNVRYVDHTYAREYSPDFPVKVAENLYINKIYADSILHQIISSELLKEVEYKYSDLGYYFFHRIIEEITGIPLESYVEENLYRHIGADIMGYLPLERFPADRIVPTENDLFFRRQLLDGYVHDPGAAMMGGVAGHAGVFSNANDLAKIMQMYLNGGTYGGRRFLSDSIIDQFNTCIYCEDGNRRGLGFDKPEMDYEKEGPTCQCVYPSSFGHTGFTGTLAWADPETGIIYIFLSNKIHPDQDNPRLVDMNVRTHIQQVIHDAILY